MQSELVPCCPHCRSQLRAEFWAHVLTHKQMLIVDLMVSTNLTIEQIAARLNYRTVHACQVMFNLACTNLGVKTGNQARYDVAMLVLGLYQFEPKEERRRA
jgi:hypothetical protein